MNTETTAWLKSKKDEIIEAHNEEKGCEEKKDYKGMWAANSKYYNLSYKVKAKLGWDTTQTNVWLVSVLAEKFADLTDKAFYNHPNAVYVKGYNGNAWMDEFRGVGISPSIYKMKAFLFDGIIWIPRQDLPNKKLNKKFFGNKTPLKRAEVQPPQNAIEVITKEHIEALKVKYGFNW